MLQSENDMIFSHLNIYRKKINSFTHKSVKIDLIDTNEKT